MYTKKIHLEPSMETREEIKKDLHEATKKARKNQFAAQISSMSFPAANQEEVVDADK